MDLKLEYKQYFDIYSKKDDHSEPTSTVKISLILTDWFEICKYSLVDVFSLQLYWDPFNMFMSTNLKILKRISQY